MSRRIEIAQPKIEVEVIKHRKDNPRPRFGQQESSSVEGVTFLVEGEGEVNFNKKTTQRIQADHDRIARAKRHVKTAGEAKKRLVGLKSLQPAFAGIISQRGDYRSPIYSKITVSYNNPDLLKKSTGEFHDELVRDEGRIVITLPTRSDGKTADELQELAETIADVMVKSGFSRMQEVASLISPTIIQRLDEERLLELEREGKIKLKPGTRTSKIEWEIQSRPLKPKLSPRKQRLEPKS